jgi:peptidoglycan/xylan/chitin deacetylase (PgdA/CDA1 family)
MNPRRTLARAISEVVACGRSFLPPPLGLRILMYHAVGTPAMGDSLGIFSLSPAIFEKHMDDLARHHTGRVVDLAPDLVIDDEPEFAISFDDGYQDNLDVAAPILTKRQLPFTVFVTADFVRQGRSGFLTPPALRQLAAVPGARIGAHGASHVALAECNDEQLKYELVSSRHYLEDTIGLAVETMAYPHGSASCRVRDAAVAAGYRLAVCSHSIVNNGARDRLLLGRTEILACDGSRVFRQKMRGDWDWYRFRTQDPLVNEVF